MMLIKFALTSYSDTIITQIVKSDNMAIMMWCWHWHGKCS